MTTVRLFDVLGREIHHEDMPAATGPGQDIRFRPSCAGASLNAGVYFLRITDGRDTAVQKLLIVH
jgi:hypothetical protein